MGTFLDPSFILLAILAWAGMGGLAYAITRLFIRRRKLPITSDSIVSGIYENAYTGCAILGLLIWFVLIPSFEGSGPAAITLEGFVGVFVGVCIGCITSMTAFKPGELNIPKQEWTDREGEPYPW